MGSSAVGEVRQSRPLVVGAGVDCVMIAGMLGVDGAVSSAGDVLFDLAPRVLLIIASTLFLRATLSSSSLRNLSSLAILAFSASSLAFSSSLIFSSLASSSALF